MGDVLNLSLLLGSVLLVGYPYVGYPLLMALAARLWPPPPPPQGELPFVSVLISAYNEARWIARKIDSTLAQDYPADRLEVIVISDGSTDATADIVSAYADPRITLLIQPERQGKSPALNRGVRGSRGDVLVFTDANALFAPEAIRNLARHFTDPTVGLVTGQGLYGELEGGTARGLANGYVWLETLIKRGESILGFIGGADGAIYACRRSLYRDLAPAQVNDLLHPIDAALAGYRSLFDGAAVTVEPPSQGGTQEFQRHVRIIAQGFTIFIGALPRLLARWRWKELWVLCSHRLFRWVSACGLAGAFFASVFGRGGLYRVALVLQAGFYGATVLGWVAERSGWRIGILSAPYYFCVVSGAGILGFVRFLRGGAEAVWNLRGENQPGAVGRRQ